MEPEFGSLNKRFVVSPFGTDLMSPSNVLRRSQGLVNELSQRVAGRVNNPLVNYATGSPFTLRDDTGVVTVAPGGVVNLRPYAKDAFRATIDPLSKSVSLGRGPIDVSAGYGSAPTPVEPGTPMYLGAPSPWARVGFTFPAPETPRPVEIESIPVTSEARQFLENELKRRQAEDPQWWRP